MAGKWVVDYGNISVAILSKEFDTEDEAIAWGRQKVNGVFELSGATYPINYLHRVYEPEWEEIKEVITEDVVPAQQSESDVQEPDNGDSETATPASNVKDGIKEKLQKWLS